MSDKMREEFEAWYEGHCAPLESGWFKRDSDFPDDYEYFPAQEAWAGWKASRAALCVDLPKRFSDERKEFSIGFDVAVEHVVAALHESGVRYK